MKSKVKKYGARLRVIFQRRYGVPFQWAKMRPHPAKSETRDPARNVSSAQTHRRIVFEGNATDPEFRFL